MFAITGITGQVGGAAARSLLEAGQRVRAVVRDKSKGETWSQRGCELAVADTYDATALTEAFKGAAGVFVMMPPAFSTSAVEKTITSPEAIPAPVTLTLSVTVVGVVD